VQHLRDFGRFEMGKRDLGHQRKDHILVADEDIFHEIENQQVLGVLQITWEFLSLQVQNIVCKH
jgi:hypothetical protein